MSSLSAHTPGLHDPLIPAIVQILLRDGNPNLRSPAQISLDPAKHLRPPSFEEGIAEYVGACSVQCVNGACRAGH